MLLQIIQIQMQPILVIIIFGIIFFGNRLWRHARHVCEHVHDTLAEMCQSPYGAITELASTGLYFSVWIINSCSYILARLKNPPKLIILLSGWTGSGKDAFYNRVAKMWFVKRCAFADHLKHMVMKKYGLTWQDCFINKNKALIQYPLNITDSWAEMVAEKLDYTFAEIDGRKYWTPRGLLILEGSITRSVDPDYWVKQVLKEINSSWWPKIFIVTDFRYKNELSMMKQNVKTNQYVEIIRINRFDRHPTNSLDDSERHLDNEPFKHVIENRGTLDDYHKQIDKLIEKLYFAHFF